VARADAGRHSEPVGGQYSDQYSDQPEQEHRAPASTGRHHGEESAERSAWAPASLPPGYERIPTARTAPPSEYEEASVYREAAAAANTYAPGLGSAEAAAQAGPPWRPAGSPWQEPRWSESSHWDQSAGASGRLERAADEPQHPALPQRVPAAPDVPGVTGLPGLEQDPGALLPTAAPELARIATYLRDEDEDGVAVRPDGFDIPAVLAAVRIVPGVRDAHVRTNAGGAQTLRLELAEDADPGEVSRAVTRLLNERMGLAAEPNDELLRPASPTPAVPKPVIPGRRRAAEDDEKTAAHERDQARYRDDVDPQADPVGSTTPYGQAAAAPVAGEVTGGTQQDRAAPDAAAQQDRAAPDAAAQHGGAARRRGEDPSDADSGDLDDGDRYSRDADSAAVESVTREPHVGRAVVSEAAGVECRVTEARALGGRGARKRAVEAPAVRTYQRVVDQGRDSVPAHHPLAGGPGAARVLLDQVEVGTQGTDAVVEVRLSADGRSVVGVARGPAFDGYVLRLAAVAGANAIDELLAGPDGAARARCFIEHATVVPMGGCEVAVVVLLLAHSGWVEELSGSAVVNGDQRQAVVRATLAAVNRRLEALLS
jgi:hypothetical protein